MDLHFETINLCSKISNILAVEIYFYSNSLETYLC